MKPGLFIFISTFFGLANGSSVFPEPLENTAAFGESCAKAKCAAELTCLGNAVCMPVDCIRDTTVEIQDKYQILDGENSLLSELHLKDFIADSQKLWAIASGAEDAEDLKVNLNKVIEHRKEALFQFADKLKKCKGFDTLFSSSHPTTKQYVRNPGGLQEANLLGGDLGPVIYVGAQVEGSAIYRASTTIFLASLGTNSSSFLTTCSGAGAGVGGDLVGVLGLVFTNDLSNIPRSSTQFDFDIGVGPGVGAAISYAYQTNGTVIFDISVSAGLSVGADIIGIQHCETKTHPSGSTKTNSTNSTA